MKSSLGHKRRVYLNGGLGNQLFGLSFALNLANYFNTEIILDTSNLMARGYQLYSLQMPSNIKVANGSPIGAVANRMASSKLKVFFPKSCYIESRLRYEPTVIQDKSKSFYFGYFQSWNYVQPVLLKMKEIVSTHELSSDFKQLSEKYFDHEFNAIHIRRGDYVSAQNYHGLAESSYYKSAFRKLEAGKNRVPTLVFSDEVSAAQVIFPNADAYIGSQSLLSPLENLLAMSRATNFIGANSSFSWWAAALNCNTEAKILFPSPWFTDSRIETQTLLAPNWKVLKRS